jgi:hypothetical protein
MFARAPAAATEKGHTRVSLQSVCGHENDVRNQTHGDQRAWRDGRENDVGNKTRGDQRA